MKKFSKLIQESNNSDFKKHPLINPVDWDEVFKPLIDHIESNLKSNVSPPGEGVFTRATKTKLDQLIDQITEDYKEYYKDVIDDGSQESFLSAFSININYQEMMDCLQELIDEADDIEDNPNWEAGCIQIEIFEPKQSMDQLSKDIKEAFHKLKMLKTNFQISIYKHTQDHSLSPLFSIRDNSPEQLVHTKMNLKDIDKVRFIRILIYNEETYQRPLY